MTSQWCHSPDGEVRRHVRLAAGVLDLAGDELHRPGPVGALGRHAPSAGALGRLDLPGDQQRHRRLDVVPDVGVLAGGPRDRAVGFLHRAIAAAVCGHVGRAQDAGDAGAAQVASGLLEVDDQALADAAG